MPNKNGLTLLQIPEAMRKYEIVQVVKEIANPEREIHVDTFLEMPTFIGVCFISNSYTLQDNKGNHLTKTDFRQILCMPWTIVYLPTKFLEWVDTEKKRVARLQASIKAGEHSNSKHSKVLEGVSSRSLASPASTSGVQGVQILKPDLKNIQRTSVSSIQNGDLINAQDLNDELEQLYTTVNQLIDIINQDAMLYGNKTIAGGLTVKGDLIVGGQHHD